MTNEKITPELIEKARSVKSPDELLALAKDNGIELTAEEADTYYSQLHPQTAELSDDELDNVAGGGCSKGSKNKSDTDNVVPGNLHTGKWYDNAPMVVPKEISVTGSWIEESCKH